MSLKHSPRAPGPRAGTAHPARTDSARAGAAYRAPTDAPRPAWVRTLALPPQPMPALWHGRPLKAWRYIAFFHPELIACLADVRIGPVRDSFWAIWDREAGRFWQGRRRVSTGDAHAAIAARRVDLALAFACAPGVETVCQAGSLYAWTAKRAPLRAAATLRARGVSRRYEGQLLIDDTAAYYPRHTLWYWSAGVGRSPAGQALAWNLVSGINDPPRDSERTIWVDGVPHEAPPNTFAEDLSAVDGLRFTPEATLRRRTNLGLLRSDYRQPMGTFSGILPGGIAVRDGLGVMERHDAWW